MSNLKIIKKISLSSSSITKILQNPYNPSQLISIQLNGYIKIMKLPNLIQKRIVSIKLINLTCIIPFINNNFRGFLFTCRNGQLGMMNQNFQIIKIIKLHQECISDIINTNLYLITVGYDGKVLFLDKDSLENVRENNLDNPLLSALYYDNHLYVASMKSYIIDLETFEVNQTKRYNNFTIVNSQIFGCSDDRGLCCLNSNSNNYIPAEFILNYQRKILIFSEKSICMANPSKKLTYKAKKYSEFSAGQTITTGFTIENNIYVGGNQGNLYWICQMVNSQT